MFTSGAIVLVVQGQVVEEDRGLTVYESSFSTSRAAFSCIMAFVLFMAMPAALRATIPALAAVLLLLRSLEYELILWFMCGLKRRKGLLDRLGHDHRDETREDSVTQHLA